MVILNEIWNNNGQYAKVDGICCCWRKAETFPIDMKIEINRELGSKYIATYDKVLNDEDCEQLFGPIGELEIKTTSAKVDINTNAIELQCSFHGEQKLIKQEFEAIA